MNLVVELAPPTRRPAAPVDGGASSSFTEGELTAATADEAFNFANRLGAFWRDAEVVSAEASTVRRCRLNTSG